MGHTRWHIVLWKGAVHQLGRKTKLSLLEVKYFLRLKRDSDIWEYISGKGMWDLRASPRNKKVRLHQ